MQGELVFEALATFEVMPVGDGYVIVARGKNRDGGRTSVALHWFKDEQEALRKCYDMEHRT